MNSADSMAATTPPTDMAVRVLNSAVDVKQLDSRSKVGGGDGFWIFVTRRSRDLCFMLVLGSRRHSVLSESEQV